jgi:hypothetical protein
LDKLKQLISDAYMQFLRFWKALFLAYLPILLLFTTLGLVSKASGDITLSYFTRDVVALGDLPFFAGLISQIGGMLWSVALGICLFTLILLNGQKRNVAAKKFLLGAVILTAILLMDDIFLVHEDIGPDYLHVGEKTIVITYFLITLYFLFTNRNEILMSDYLILGLALAMFGISIFLDAADLDDYDRYSFIFTEQFQIFLEDGFKFAGITTWLLYFARYSFQTLSWGVNHTTTVVPQSVQSSQRVL